MIAFNNVDMLMLLTIFVLLMSLTRVGMRAASFINGIQPRTRSGKSWT